MSKLTSGPDRLQMLRATGDGLRPGERTEILGAHLVSTPSHVADALGVDEGDNVERRRRAYYDGQGVVALSTSWLPGRIAEAAPELLVNQPLPKMTFGLVEERTGRRAAKRRDIVAIKPVLEDVAAVLNLDPGVPVLTMTNCYWDQHGEVTEYAEDYLGQGREL
ncbi:UTRA domain-containing protein [Microbispora sitophila]|uniref:UTRA domain-containing protein n=1 Tax=Microbispora sitophila TaxID=2771537 RepID=UPI001D009074|nr:UTRA domain-containing protein [Microbispora sitophila]